MCFDAQPEQRVPVGILSYSGVSGVQVRSTVKRVLLSYLYTSPELLDDEKHRQRDGAHAPEGCVRAIAMSVLQSRASLAGLS